MPAPSQIAINTSALNRLVKEQASYHKELEQQQASIAKLEQQQGGSDENAEFTLRQEVSTYQQSCIRIVVKLHSGYRAALMYRKTHAHSSPIFMLAHAMY